MHPVGSKWCFQLVPRPPLPLLLRLLSSTRMIPPTHHHLDLSLEAFISTPPNTTLWLERGSVFSGTLKTVVDWSKTGAYSLNQSCWPSPACVSQIFKAALAS